MDMMNGVLGGLGLIAAMQAVMLWRCARALNRLQPIVARVTQVGDALSLLTDTTESAFRAVALELGKPRSAPARAASVRRTTRVSRAAKKGKSVAEIAAAEEVSEGEVRLRLHIANENPPAPPAKARKTRKEGTRGTVRLG
jgi:hypothetical protein